MSRETPHTQSTSTADLIHLETTTTSTSDLLTFTHVATQTEERDSFSSEGEFDSSDDELETSEGEEDLSDEETSPKHLMREDEQRRQREDHGRTNRDRLELSEEAEGGTNESPAAEITFSEAVDHVEIIQNQTVINNNYLCGNLEVNWSALIAEKMAEEFSRAQQQHERHANSIKRSLKKAIKKSEATIKDYIRQLVHHQAAGNDAQTQLLQDQIAQQREEINRHQHEIIDLQKQKMDHLAQLAAEQKEALKKEKEAKSYAFNLGGKHKRVLERVWTGLEQSQVVQLTKRLYKKFKIRLRQVAVYCGMKFVVDVPTDNVEILTEQQAAIQETILEILPEEFQDEVEWEEPTEILAGEAELPHPVQVSEVQDQIPADATSTSDQTVASAYESLMVTDSTVAADDSESPLTRPDIANCSVTSLLITKSNLLIVTDFNAMKVTCTPLDPSKTQPDTDLYLSVHPWGMAIFKDDIIVVATHTSVIFLLEVGRDMIRKVKEVDTVRMYTGVTSYGDGGLLVVSSWEDSLGPAVVDVITDEGKVLWTVTNSHTLPALCSPVHLHLRNHQVLVSDKNGIIHQVDVNSGRPYPPLHHPDLKSPGQVTMDDDGQHVYVTSCQEKCVLEFSVLSGQWRTLLTGPDPGERGTETPQAVGVTQDGKMVVVAWEKDTGHTEVAVYSLDQLLSN